MNWYLKVVKDNYVNFRGRARRKEYWMFMLFHILIIFVLGFTSAILTDSFDNENSSFFIVVGLYVLATLLPSIAVTVRRLHDIGKSGWFYLIRFIPYVGGIILFVFTVQNGNVGSNKYGSDPKAPDFDEIDEIGQPVLEE